MLHYIGCKDGSSPHCRGQILHRPGGVEEGGERGMGEREEGGGMRGGKEVEGVEEVEDVELPTCQ